MGITDANSAGFIHGGTVMKLSDEAAGLAAVRHSHSRVVTAAVDRMTFLNPVFVGELLTLNARVNTDPRTLEAIVRRTLAEGGARPALRSDLTFLECFSPLPPQPTYRLLPA